MCNDVPSLSVCLIRSPFLFSRSIPHSHTLYLIHFNFPVNISVVSSVSRSTLNRPTHTTHDSFPSRALIYMKFYSLCMHTRAALLLRDHPRRAFAVVKFTSLFATAISYMRESREQRRGVCTSRSLFTPFNLFFA